MRVPLEESDVWPHTVHFNTVNHFNHGGAVLSWTLENLLRAVLGQMMGRKLPRAPWLHASGCGSGGRVSLAAFP